MISLGLPVEDILPLLKQQLATRHEAVLQAAPGAGKTTLVPLALMDEPWLTGKKILMLEPRRIAARSAAHRIASLLGEQPGKRIGYRMRLDTKVSQHTQVEVITEGILTRMLQQDPALEGVGLVIFDEFHERSLDSDLALSLCLKGRALFRDEHDPLKLLVMSATLDSDAIAHLLDDAPIVTSGGRAYPVDIIYGQPRQARERVVERMVETIKQAMTANPESSLLAFLPGQGEIRQTANLLSEWIQNRKDSDIHLRPLYGNLSLQEQQEAIAPLSGHLQDHRKIVLATNIAETSLTIEGVDIVVDSGLVRESIFNPAIGMAGLHTTRISQASSEQRAGRAGRLRPGKCYRLWSAEQQQQLAPHSTAEILTADLAPLALQLLQWGVDNPNELTWLDPPPTALWQQALDLLNRLGALEQRGKSWILTAHGEAMTQLPTHPRLAHLLLTSAAMGSAEASRYGTLLAALLSDRDPFSRDQPDLHHRIELLTEQRSCPPLHRGWLQRTQQLAEQLYQQLTQCDKHPHTGVISLVPSSQWLGYLLATAYPDRIARRRHSGGYQLANGRSGQFTGQPILAKSHWLAVAEVSSQPGGKGDLIRTAVNLDETLFNTALAGLTTEATVAEWDKKANRFIAEQQQKIGALVLQRKRLTDVPEAAKTAAIIAHIRQQGLNLLPWTAELKQWCARVSLLRATDTQHTWPDVSDSGLLSGLEDWLAPYLTAVNSFNDFKKIPLADCLSSQLSWDQQQSLATLAPSHFSVPSGSKIRIDYLENPPVLAVKLQEMFGCEQTPSIVKGNVALLVHLLSPAGRPLQITQDLAGFWRTSYHEVKKDMKGRYPKHPWPDDPLVAIATRKTKHPRR